MLKTVVTQAMHATGSNGRWIAIPSDMKPQYDKLGWQTRELVERGAAEQAIEQARAEVAA